MTVCNENDLVCMCIFPVALHLNKLQQKAAYYWHAYHKQMCGFYYCDGI